MLRSLLSAGCVALGLVATGAVAAPLTPLDVTGYTSDVVVDASAAAPFAAAVTANMDYGRAFPSNPNPDITTWYERGLRGSPRGLPMGTVFAAADDPNTSFSLRPASGANAVLLDASVRTAHVGLLTPASFSALAFLTASGNGSGGFQVIGELAAGGTVLLGTVASPDWFAAGPIGVRAGGRASALRSLVYDYGGGSPSLFDERLALAAPTAPLSGFDLLWTGGSNSTAIMGFSGTALALATVSEPATLALLGTMLTALGLLGRRRAPWRAGRMRQPAPSPTA